MAVALEAGFPVLSAVTARTAHIVQSVAVGAGANRVLVVMVAIEDALVSVASATFGGVALTKLGSFTGTSFARVECWYLIAPANSTANVDLTPTGGTAASSWAAAIYVFDGADQTTPLRAAAGAGADAGTSSSHAVAGFTAGDYGLDIQSIDSTGHAPAAGASQTADYATQSMGAGTNEYRGSHKTADGTLAWTWTTSAPNAHIATAVIPAAGAGATVTFAATPAGVTTVTMGVAETKAFVASVAGAAAATGALSDTVALQALAAGRATVVAADALAEVFAAVAAGTATVVATLDSPAGPVSVVVDHHEHQVYIALGQF